MKNFEKTLVLIKPDAKDKEIVPLIQKGIDTADLRITAASVIVFDLERLMKFYNIPEIRHPYEVVREYLCDRPLEIWFVEGENAISKLTALKNALRVIYGTSRLVNLLHCPSSSEESAWQLEFVKKLNEVGDHATHRSIE